MQEIKISARQLVELVMRSGDLDNRMQSSTRAVDGIKAHQHFQNLQDEDYEAEVSVATSVQWEEALVIISGRMDGLFSDDEGLVVDEIKSTQRDLDELEEDYNELHWAQAMIYAYILVKEHGVENIKVRLTYIAIENYATKHFYRSFTRESINDFFELVINRYREFVTINSNWLSKRQSSLQQAKFPYDTYRQGQREMAVMTYKSIIDEKTSFFEAATGIGKTLSTLFPTMKAMGEGKVDKCFYLTAKTIARTVAEDSVEKMRNKGAHIRSLTLTAKEKLCPLDDMKCNPDDCSYAKGHFDRVNRALLSILADAEDYRRPEIQKYSEEFHVCPYEFSLDVSLFSDVIIGDYNYAFDPRVYLRRFFEVPSERYVLLVDEAHNLVNRGRSMYSTELSKQSILSLKRKVKGIRDLKLALDGINRAFLTIINELDEHENEHVFEDEKEAVVNAIRKQLPRFEEWLLKNRGHDEYDEVLDMFFQLTHYLRLSESYDSGDRFLVKEVDKDTIIQIFAINLATKLKPFLEKALSTVFFSATFSPIDYYQHIFLGDEDIGYRLRIPSPFDPEKRLVYVDQYTDTRYRQRANYYQHIARRIHEVFESKEGNYLVFFPSYRFLRDVYDVYVDMFGDEHVNVQERDMSDEAREAFLSFFSDFQGHLNFAVLGGIFSEGIDLTGDRLIGTIVVSVGLPMVSFENNIIKDYYDQTLGEGFNYSYVFPGMNRVMQAAGRVIRTVDDKGVILLVGQRFTQREYARLLPRDWGTKVINNHNFNEILRKFWYSVSNET